MGASKKKEVIMSENELTLKIGIVTVSDRASSGEYEDLGGPKVREELSGFIKSSWSESYHIVPDEKNELKTLLKKLSDEEKCSLIITTGGTGPSPRDVTPEATIEVADKELPGFGEAMRRISFDKVPTSILSRQTAVIRGSTLIINLPGSPKAIKECLEVVFPAVPDCIDLIGGPFIETNESKVTAIHFHKHKN